MMVPLIDIHTHHRKNSLDTIEVLSTSNLQDNVPNTYYSFAVHPWYIQQQTNDASNAWQHLQNKNCIALGEVGLDKLSVVDFAKQEEVFSSLLQINTAFNLPVIIHCVKAQQELLAITKKYNFPFVIHGFNQKEVIAQKYLEQQYYLSFGSALLIDGSNAQRQLLQTPLDKIFFETDDKPDLSIIDIYEKAAALLGITIESLKKVCFENFRTIFVNL